ncbi:MAG TPA: hypothetical protein VKT51_10150 [Candidatus Eremiobacteraceae bacterium]|nr:hypothetical protein [Candidatus Eremiobacteraceae bacterium]
MRGLRSFAFGLAALFVVASIAQSSALACATARGKRVELTSQSLDPDVFVWDSMARLINYQSGKFVTDDVLHHTLLAPAGTRAVVLTCRDRVVHPRFVNGVADAVGVRLLSGRYRGQYGWVVSEDLHMLLGSPAPNPPR